MIRFESVTKQFPDAARPAVDRLDLDVPEGAILALVGPSGCGKTSTLRMVNRLAEPSAGRVLVGGEPIALADPVSLRRRIGYAIQGVGLFPHRTVADNVATVPRLLGWPRARIDARVEEMLGLVGLDPALFARRRPGQLSGGQRQRVGLARALAADPPILLMDEPFGALDPVVRARLQGEVAAILKRLRKTVILVTHDIDEAMGMGDLVAVMREGRIAQLGPPDALLDAPADAFVANFLGSERALRRLALVTAGQACADAPAPTPTPDGVPTLPASATLREALSLLLAEGAEIACVRDEAGQAVGTLTLAAIRERAGRPTADPR